MRSFRPSIGSGPIAAICIEKPATARAMETPNAEKWSRLGRAWPKLVLLAVRVLDEGECSLQEQDVFHCVYLFFVQRRNREFTCSGCYFPSSCQVWKQCCERPKKLRCFVCLYT